MIGDGVSEEGYPGHGPARSWPPSGGLPGRRPPLPGGGDDRPRATGGSGLETGRKEGIEVHFDDRRPALGRPSSDPAPPLAPRPRPAGGPNRSRRAGSRSPAPCPPPL